MTPTVDDPALGADPTRNDDFSFNSVFPDDQSTQDRCPFAAHIRKTNPRADLKNFSGTEIRRIIRSGIAFGPEVSANEASSGKTSQDRGLLFVCYQSNISNGFQFIQQSMGVPLLSPNGIRLKVHSLIPHLGWANNPGFPIAKPVQPGFDPIIGQIGQNDKKGFQVAGVNPNSQSSNLPLPTKILLTKSVDYFY